MKHLPFAVVHLAVTNTTAPSLAAIAGKSSGAIKEA